MNDEEATRPGRSEPQRATGTSGTTRDARVPGEARRSRLPRLSRLPCLPSVARRAVRRLRYAPTERHLLLRRLWYAPLALADRVRGRHDPDLPPRWLRVVGRGDFVATGERFVDHFVRLGGLEPRHAVLDVGCGVGRMALPLTLILRHVGSYDGFDANAAAVRWCRDHITVTNPSFRFHEANVRNTRYNPRGRAEASTFTFPFPASRFDFVIVTSVFTHLSLAGVSRYVAESARVLRPGGTLFATFFLMDEEARRRIDRGESTLRFTVPGPGGQWTLAERPADADYLGALDESSVREIFRSAGLTYGEAVYWGSWSGRSPHTDYQDIVVARREA